MVSVRLPAVPAAATDVGETVTVQTLVTFAGSVALALAEPPPETLTWLVTAGGAFAATFTVTVIDG
jgi:hypothetical protein